MTVRPSPCPQVNPCPLRWAPCGPCWRPTEHRWQPLPTLLRPLRWCAELIPVPEVRTDMGQRRMTRRWVLAGAGIAALGISGVGAGMVADVLPGGAQLRRLLRLDGGD